MVTSDCSREDLAKIPVKLRGRTYSVDVDNISIFRGKLESLFDEEFSLTPNIHYEANKIKPFLEKDKLIVQLYMQGLKDAEDKGFHKEFDGNILIPKLDDIALNGGEILFATLKNAFDKRYFQKFQLVLNYECLDEEPCYTAHSKITQTRLDKAFSKYVLSS